MLEFIKLFKQNPLECLSNLKKYFLQFTETALALISSHWHVIQNEPHFQQLNAKTTHYKHEGLIIHIQYKAWQTSLLFPQSVNYFDSYTLHST